MVGPVVESPNFRSVRLLGFLNVTEGRRKGEGCDQPSGDHQEPACRSRPVDEHDPREPAQRQVSGKQEHAQRDRRRGDEDAAVGPDPRYGAEAGEGRRMKEQKIGRGRDGRIAGKMRARRGKPDAGSTKQARERSNTISQPRIDVASIQPERSAGAILRTSSHRSRAASTPHTAPKHRKSCRQCPTKAGGSGQGWLPSGRKRG